MMVRFLGDRLSRFRLSQGSAATITRSLDELLGKRELFAQGLRGRRVKNAVFLGAIAALLAIPPVFVNHPIGYMPLIAYLLILLMSWVYLQAIARGLTVEHGFAETSCLRGVSVNLPITLVNRSYLPILRAQPHVYVKNPYGLVEHEVFAMAMVNARGSDSMSAQVMLGHVGVYAAGLQGVFLYDPFMLFRKFVEAEGHAELVSTPRDFVADAVELSDMAVHESSAPVRTVISDNVDYAGTRDYEYGDPMKSVHWKLSARLGELQTRLFEASVNTKLAVVMDFHAPDYEPEELMECADTIVEMALAVMRLAKRRNLEATLCYADKHGAEVIRALPESDEMSRFVASLPPLSAEVDGQRALDIARSEAGRNGGSDSVVLCTSELSKQLVIAVQGMRGERLSVSVVLAVPRARVRTFRKENSGVLAELSSAGVACAVLSDAHDFEPERSYG